MINLKCFLFGHNLSAETDSGYDHCLDCKAHQWYSEEARLYGDAMVNNFTFTLPYFFHLMRFRISWRYAKIRDWLGEKCGDCGKAKYRFGKYTGNHDTCLPF